MKRENLLCRVSPEKKDGLRLFVIKKKITVQSFLAAFIDVVNEVEAKKAEKKDVNFIDRLVRRLEN